MRCTTHRSLYGGGQKRKNKNDRNRRTLTLHVSADSLYLYFYPALPHSVCAIEHRRALIRWHRCAVDSWKMIEIFVLFFWSRAADVFCMSRLLLSILAFVLSLASALAFHNNRHSLCSLLLFFLSIVSSGIRLCVIVSNLFFFLPIFGLIHFHHL